MIVSFPDTIILHRTWLYINDIINKIGPRYYVMLWLGAYILQSYCYFSISETTLTNMCKFSTLSLESQRNDNNTKITSQTKPCVYLWDIPY